MIRQSRAVSIAVSLGLLSLAIPVSAYAQSADLVLCDRIAADPSDPDKPTDVKGTAEIAPSDIPTAIKFCKTASTSSRRALYELGRAYAANRQMVEAIGAWRKAVDKGSTAAMVELGVLLGTGTGVAKDEAAARKLFERAAEAGNPRGVTNLAALSAGGAPSDPTKARAMLAKAAEANSAEAQYQLGLMTANGIGGPKDDVAARALFEKAAAQTIRGQWSEWAHLPKADEAACRTLRQQRPITKRPQHSATKTPRPLSSAWNVLTSLRTSAGIS
jgi:uncharacterized protein